MKNAKSVAPIFCYVGFFISAITLLVMSIQRFDFSSSISQPAIRSVEYPQPDAHKSAVRKGWDWLMGK